MSRVLTKLTRRALRLGQWCPGYLPLARRARARSLAVLMYHGVTAQPLETFNWCHIDRLTFAQQIQFLSQRYTVMPLVEALDRLEQGKPLPPSPAVVTFDDGFRTVYTNALPILEEYGVPATVFLVTSLIGTRQPAWPDQLYYTVANGSRTQVRFASRDWSLATADDRADTYRSLAGLLKAMTEDAKRDRLDRLLDDLGGVIPIPANSPFATLDWFEIEELARTGLIDFGSHTHTHPILAHCSSARQEDELRRSRDLIHSRLGRCDLFAYPNGGRGDFSRVTQQLLTKLGYRCGLSTIPGLNSHRTDRFALQRVNISADTNMAEFKLLMVGL